MKSDEKNENPFCGTSTPERLTDSLLKNHATNPGGGDDEEFLARVEAAMDAETGGHTEFATTEAADLPEPSNAGFRRRRLAWAAGIAAVLMIGFGALALNVHRSHDRPNPPQFVVNSTAVSEDTIVLNQRIERMQRPSVSAVASVEAAPHDRLQPVNHRPGGDPYTYDPSSIAVPSVKPLPEYEALSFGLSESNGRTTPSDSGLGMVSMSNGDSGFGMSQAGFGNKNRSSNYGESSVARYAEIIDNRWKSPIREPLSTFSIDVDTASWTNIRSMLERNFPIGSIPKGAVRIEEMINYFDWDYPQPAGKDPFGYAIESASCPWNEDHRLLRVAIQGKDVKRHKRPAANLVFLLDVSGSMNQPNKLPLVQRAISILVEELDEDDRVSMVVYAGSEGVALQPTPGNRQREILDALNRLQAGGSTNGGAGIARAYRIAAENFAKDGINRVILCTDGDFNVGLTGTESLIEFVERKAKRDRVFLSVCGFGVDNLNDAMLEGITNKGNGTYYYIDSFSEARKVFLKDLMGTLVTIAKDVKIQIEFNPGQVQSYRLIGYANRLLAAKDFEDDRVDAGEIGAGHSVTAFYEIVPAGAEGVPNDVTSNLRYQKNAEPDPDPQPERKIVPSPELALVKLRYKKPDEDRSQYVEQTVLPNERSWHKASTDFRFASAVALFGLKLRGHESARHTELDDIIDIAREAVGNDTWGYRAEFVKLLEKARDH